jgi:hypothetical protein
MPPIVFLGENGWCFWILLCRDGHRLLSSLSMFKSPFVHSDLPSEWGSQTLRLLVNVSNKNVRKVTEIMTPFEVAALGAI